jgi:hypothetical protein
MPATALHQRERQCHDPNAEQYRAGVEDAGEPSTALTRWMAAPYVECAARPPARETLGWVEHALELLHERGQYALDAAELGAGPDARMLVAAVTAIRHRTVASVCHIVPRPAGRPYRSRA